MGSGQKVGAKNTVVFLLIFRYSNFIQVPGHEHKYHYHAAITDKHLDFAVTEIAPQSECVAKCVISVEIGGRKYTADMKVLFFSFARKTCS